VTANSRDAALRVQQRRMAEVSIVAPNSAAEEHAAELARSVRDSAGTGDDALGSVVTSGTGTDADAGEYLNK
jgi:DNA-directed RNA polymerase subunit beta'